MVPDNEYWPTASTRQIFKFQIDVEAKLLHQIYVILVEVNKELYKEQSKYVFIYSQQNI